MPTLKIIFCSALAVVSFTVFLFAKDKPWEIKFYKRSVFFGTIGKFILCILVYTLWPQLSQYSDALSYTFPQTLEFISGKIPNRDFVSAYSILFCPFFAIPLMIWRSVGSIVLTVLLMETAMIVLYLRRCHDKEATSCWRTAFLYCFSPFSLYWVALVGHNGVMIAFWTMLSLVLAERGKAVISGFVCAFGFMATKVLAVLAWPGVVFYERRKWVARALPVAFSLVITACLLLFDIDVLSFMRYEFHALTSGNLLFIVSRIFPGLRESADWHFVPVLLFVIAFIPMFSAYVKRQADSRIDRFNASAAFVASTFMLFLIFSKVSYNYYIVMVLIFVIHTLAGDERHIVRRLIPFAFLGTVTYLEQYLYYKSIYRNYPFTSLGGLILFIIDILTVCSYVYYIIVCFRISIGKGFDKEPEPA